MKTTARDIAKICGTSLSAVSRAFRADASISPELRQLILGEAAKRGYTPPQKRAREGRNAIAFAVVIGDIDNPFYAQALKLFSAAAKALDWEMTTLIAPDRGSLDGQTDRVLAMPIDAVILTSAELSSTLSQACRSRGLPVILFNRVQVDAEMTAVCADNFGGGKLAGQRLFGQGRSCFAYVGGRRSTSTHLERRRGFLDVLEAAGQNLEYDLVGEYDYEISLELGRRLFDSTSPPDGVFCANDQMGFALIDAAHEAGLEPGRDVSIIGYDDVPMARWPRYQLTTISQNVENMVDETMTVMRRVTSAPSQEGQIVVVPADLVVRNSG
ncbi:MAG: substrate-binding domain-containing protein [Pseudomonadota bacterium]